MVGLLFSHIRVTNVRLINEKIYLIIEVSKWHDLSNSVTFVVFSLFVVSTYSSIFVIFI